MVSISLSRNLSPTLFALAFMLLAAAYLAAMHGFVRMATQVLRCTLSWSRFSETWSDFCPCANIGKGRVRNVYDHATGHAFASGLP